MTFSRRLRLASGLVFCGLLSACVSAQINDLSNVSVAVAGGDKVAILTQRQDALKESESDFSSCLYGELTSGTHKLQVMDEDTFRDALFPWFEPRLAPARAEDLARSLANVEVARRLAELHVRYLVWIHGETESKNEKGSMSCAVGPGGGGCFGMMIWDKDSAYKASIWDLQTRSDLGTIQSEASGTSYVPALILPIPMIARTQGAACENMGERLRAAFAGTP